MSYIVNNAELRAQHDLSNLRGFTFVGAGSSVAFKEYTMRQFPTTVVRLVMATYPR